MDEDVASDAGAVMAHVAETFSWGVSSVSRDDTLPDGRFVGQVVEGILAAADGQEAPGVDEGVLAALRCMDATWGSGFDLAVAEDLADDDRTLRHLVEAWAAAGTAPRP